MTLADDLVAAQAPFVDASPDGSHEALLRAFGVMFAQMEDYAADPDEDDTPTPYVVIPNEAPNPNFEHDQVGVAPAGWGIPGLLATNKVDTNWARSGVQSYRLVTNALTASQQGSVFISGPDLGPGAFSSTAGWNISRLKTGSVAASLAYHVNSITGSFRAYMEVWCHDATGAFISAPTTNPGLVGAAGSTGASAGVMTLPAGTAWIRVSLIVFCVTAGTLDINFDNIGLYFDPAGGVPAYTDPDIIGSGWVWTGTPGNSVSQIAPDVPQVGWSKMLDVDLADTAGLPYLAQWIGERIPAGMGDAAARQLIRQNPNAYRGTLAAVARGIMPMLTGSQSVFTKERAKNDGTTDVNWLAVLTYASETPNQTLVQQVLRNKLVPANIMLDYATLSRNTWATIEAGPKTWTTVESGSPSWLTIESVLGAPAGYSLWTP